MKRMTMYAARLCLATLFVTAGVCLAEEEIKGEEQHALVGVDQVSDQEEMEDRIARAARCPYEEGTEQDVPEPVILEQPDTRSLEERIANEEPEEKKTIITSHEGALHWAIGVTPNGDTVQLEDGSFWVVKWSDQWKTLNWLATDTIIVTPNTAWFSTKFCLENLNTGASCQADMSLGPIINGIYTHWIIAVDTFHDQVYLEDGSIWKVASYDSAKLYKWFPGDAVFIGINSGWFTDTRPNVLINVRMYNYVESICIH